MSGAPAIYIPRGLSKVHPGLEQSIKSIGDAIAKLHSGVTAAAQGNTAAQLQSLASQIEGIAQEVDALAAATGTTFTAAQTLPSFCVAYESAAGKLSLADNTSSATSNAIAGIVLSLANVGATVALAEQGGSVTNPAWSLTVGPVYLGTGGGITQTIPATNPVIVGWAINATTVFVNVLPVSAPLDSPKFTTKVDTASNAATYHVNGVQIAGPRVTGWGASSGLLSRTAYAAYAGQTYGATYSATAEQQTDDALKLLSQTVAALITDLTAHGLIGT